MGSLQSSAKMRREAHLLIAIIRIEDGVICILEHHADADALLDGDLVGVLHLPYLPIAPVLLLVTAMRNHMSGLSSRVSRLSEEAIVPARSLNLCLDSSW